MTAIKASEVDRYIARPDAGEPIVLVFGPDAGLVRERVDALVRASVDDPNDPFAFVRIEGEDLAANPSRLVEEAHTVPLFGGRRAVLVRAGARNISAAVETVIAAPSNECRVIIEAGNLSKSAPLAHPVREGQGRRRPALLCRRRARSDSADRRGDAQQHSHHCARCARGADVAFGRRPARLAKRDPQARALCAGPERVELADVMAVTADASALALDGVIDAAFAARTAEVEIEFTKARAGGSSPAAILSAAIRQVANLHKMRLAIDGGDSADFAMKRAAPPVHFTRQAQVSEALRAWTAPRLLRAMQQLAEASLEARRNSPLADAIAQRTLLSVAVSARRREG